MLTFNLSLASRYDSKNVLLWFRRFKSDIQKKTANTWLSFFFGLSQHSLCSCQHSHSISAIFKQKIHFGFTLLLCFTEQLLQLQLATTDLQHLSHQLQLWHKTILISSDVKCKKVHLWLWYWRLALPLSDYWQQEFLQWHNQHGKGYTKPGPQQHIIFNQKSKGFLFRSPDFYQLT